MSPELSEIQELTLAMLHDANMRGSCVYFTAGSVHGVAVEELVAFGLAEIDHIRPSKAKYHGISSAGLELLKSRANNGGPVDERRKG